VFTAFEAGMPIVGILAGRALGELMGPRAEYGAIFFLLGAGALLLWPRGDEDREERRLGLLARSRGIAVLGLGLGISLDELTIGLSAGLVGLPIAITVAWIALQAFAAAQIGIRLGARIGDRFRERAQWLAGVTLVVVAVILLVLKLYPI